jgi:hypothetical protein
VKHKSPGCEDLAEAADKANLTLSSKKQSRPAEYDAEAALPCPDIEIGSRHPVTCI